MTGRLTDYFKHLRRGKEECPASCSDAWRVRQTDPYTGAAVSQLADLVRPWHRPRSSCQLSNDTCSVLRDLLIILCPGAALLTYKHNKQQNRITITKSR
ncbi:hypothetical protein J6590_003436 [Homalodisca vitripennis]|nr:hypothetical protein J6590_003436 [Homalodisca vitripennis]